MSIVQPLFYFSYVNGELGLHFNAINQKSRPPFNYYYLCIHSHFKVRVMRFIELFMDRTWSLNAISKWISP